MSLGTRYLVAPWVLGSWGVWSGGSLVRVFCNRYSALAWCVRAGREG